MQTAPLLVLGATGKTGRRIVRRLTDRGLPVREGSRRGDPAFAWDDPAGWPAVLEGVSAVYISFFPDLIVDGALEAITELTRVAREAGVQRLVLLSGRGEPNARRCEQVVLGSGVPATVLRAAWFAQNFSEGHLRDLVFEGALALPAGATREPLVDADDIADVAVAALTEDGHAGQVYELTGPRLLGFDEVAAELSGAAQRPVQYVPVTREAFHAGVTESVGPEMGDLLAELCGELLDGRNEWLGDGVQRALGREPRDFAAVCAEAATAGAWTD